MRNPHKRLEALEAKVSPPAPIRIHLIGWSDGLTKAEAIAAYERESGPVEDRHDIIFLCGRKPAEADC
jgi:hypothetical protein